MSNENKPMSNNQLPADVQERIKADSIKSYPIPVKFLDQVSCMERREGYIAGATAERERAQLLVDMLMNVRAFIAGATAGAMHPFTSLITLGKEVETVLQQWKGEGKEVTDPCPHCGKELHRDRNLCCRECGKEVGDGA